MMEHAGRGEGEGQEAESLADIQLLGELIDLEGLELALGACGVGQTFWKGRGTWTGSSQRSSMRREPMAQ